MIHVGKILLHNGREIFLFWFYQIINPQLFTLGTGGNDLDTNSAKQYESG